MAPAHADAEPRTTDTEHRGRSTRLKRRRKSSHSPERFHRVRPDTHDARTRVHDSDSGSDSESSVPSPSAKKKSRRRSDAEPDHTLRGRARKRECSRNGVATPISESGSGGDGEEGYRRGKRRRSSPPSRRSESLEGDEEVRRQRSLPNLYRVVSEGVHGDGGWDTSDGEGGEGKGDAG